LAPDRGDPKADLVQVIGPDGRLRSTTQGLRGVSPLVDVTAVRSSGAQGAQVLRSLQRPDVDLAALGVARAMTSLGSSPGGTGALVVAVDAEGYSTANTGLLRMILVGLGAVLVGTGVLAWALAGRALRTVTRLTEEAEAISLSDIGRGLPAPARDTELARLAASLNRMLSRLGETHHREMALAADAGHRLRTPIATLRADAELALRDTDPQLVSAALERIVEDADQLTLVVDRMLAAARPTTGDERTVGQSIASARATWSRQAERVGARLRLTTGPLAAELSVSAPMVDILDPLLDNAFRHVGPGGEVAVDVGADHDAAVLVIDVADTGNGVSPALRSHLFDAWVTSRDAGVAGGLGLWLARESARGCGGDIALIDGSPGHTTFRVSLPLSTTPEPGGASI
jgi:signal transduction histidine kinase